MHITPARSYRATLIPKDVSPADALRHADAGLLPVVQVKAANPAHAQRAAHHVTGLPVLRVERRDEVAA